MKSQYPLSSADFSAESSPLDTPMAIILNAENVPAVMSFLLSLRIPFSLSTVEGETNHKKNLSGPKVEHGELNNVESTPIERIYQQYIIERPGATFQKIEGVAEEVGMSIAQLKSHFKKNYGRGFYRFYIEAKMEYAATLLVKGLKASEVSVHLGYSHPVKFNKMFQKHFGITPKRYQVAKRKQTEPFTELVTERR